MGILDRERAEEGILSWKQWVADRCFQANPKLERRNN